VLIIILFRLIRISRRVEQRRRRRSSVLRFCIRFLLVICNKHFLRRTVKEEEFWI